MHHNITDDLTTWSDDALAQLINWRGFVNPTLAKLIVAACHEMGRRIQEKMHAPAD